MVIDPIGLFKFSLCNFVGITDWTFKNLSRLGSQAETYHEISPTDLSEFSRSPKDPVVPGPPGSDLSCSPEGWEPCKLGTRLVFQEGFVKHWLQ